MAAVGVYSQLAYAPYGPPGGFDAGLHFSAGAPLSATPVGRENGNAVVALQPVKVIFL